MFMATTIFFHRGNYYDYEQLLFFYRGNYYVYGQLLFFSYR